MRWFRVLRRKLNRISDAVLDWWDLKILEHDLWLNAECAKDLQLIEETVQDPVEAAKLRAWVRKRKRGWM